MSIIERIRNRPLSIRFVEYTTTGFAVLLIGFMVYVTFFDLRRVSTFKSMFKRETVIEQAEKSPDTTSPAASPAPVR